jgi:hypothetical protein
VIITDTLGMVVERYRKTTIDNCGCDNADRTNAADNADNASLFSLMNEAKNKSLFLIL